MGTSRGRRSRQKVLTNELFKQKAACTIYLAASLYILIHILQVNILLRLQANMRETPKDQSDEITSWPVCGAELFVYRQQSFRVAIELFCPSFFPFLRLYYNCVN
jgi:hypothetical protein